MAKPPKRSAVKYKLFLTLLAVGLFFCLPESQAQFYFGKNKVQYTSFDWQVMTTDHFRIYYYKAEEEIAKIGAKYAEDSYRALAVKFNHELRKPVPMVFYSSPLFFSQTNIIPGLLPESVAGFTEFMKGRVVVPFHGSLHDFDHVIRHELVHVFTISKLDDNTDHRKRYRFASPPLWFIEGIAEFWSKQWDVPADMIVKDMVINNRLFTIDRLWQVNGTYFMYKLGESICQFIDSTYGSDKLTQLFENWHKAKTFDGIVELTLGESLKEVSRKWEYSLKKKYFPQIAELGLPKMDSRAITHDGYSVKGVPIRWDDGNGEKDWLVFKANRLGYTGIYMKPLDKRKGDIKTLLKGERSSDFESLYLLGSGIDVNNDKIVFSSRSKEKDVIYIYDLNEGEVTRRFEFDELVGAISPRFSPDGDRITFTGVGIDGHADIYLLNTADRGYRAVTDDIYFDIDPTFSSDGRSIVFASDRCPEGEGGSKNIYSIDLDSKIITQLTSGAFLDQAPVCTKDGIFFSSDREGTFNIFYRDNQGELTRQSTYVTAAIDPRVCPDGKRLVYTGYQDMAFQVYLMDLPEEPEIIEQPAIAATTPWRADLIDRESHNTTIKYDTDYSLDIAQSTIGYDPVYGSIGGIQAGLSDVLGNRSIHLLLTNTARTKDDLLESFNFGVTYINRERRLNWGVGAFHLFDEYYNDYDFYFYEREAGGISLFSYPISKFSRFDFTTLARYSKRERLYGLGTREAFLVTNYLSWIYDNSLWEFTGPLEGRRYNFTIGITNSISDLNSFNRTGMADIRHYFRLGRNSAFASRLFGYSSTGLEPRRIYFGGSWSFRGYDRRAFYNRNILFASHELRFPLIDNLLIGFPIGGLGFSGIRGALFFDTGSAWDEEFDQFYGSFGAGFRVSLGYVIVFRFDFARTTDFDTISPNTDFDFFFGWNF